MKKKNIILLTILVIVIFLSGCVSQKRPVQVPEVQPSWPFTLEDEQLILTPRYADPSVILIADGLYFMYVNTMGDLEGLSGGGTFLMTSNNGISWTRQSDILFPGVAMGRAFKESNGIRFYYPAPPEGWIARYEKEPAPKVIISAFSIDGRSGWQKEGISINPREGHAVTGPTVFHLPNGSYRMYFDEIKLPEEREQAVLESVIYGASSPDGLAWTRDNEPTIVYEDEVEGADSRHTQPAQVLHPAVVEWSEQNGYILLYNSHSRIFAAFSSDGFKWQKLGYTGIRGADADIIKLPDSRFRIYWGGGCTDISESGCSDPETGQLIPSTIHTGILILKEAEH